MCIWYECDEEKPMTKRTIYCFGTGHEMPVDVKLQYIGTIVLSDGELVFHYFEKVWVMTSLLFGIFGFVFGWCICIVCKNNGII